MDSRKAEHDAEVPKMRKLSTPAERERHMQEAMKLPWRAVVSKRALSEPAMFIAKVVQKTDADEQQNRFEISIDDMRDSMALLEMGVRTNYKRTVDVLAFDKEGREYKLFFRFIESNSRFRFNGSDWGRFMKDNRLRAGQNISVWGWTDGEPGKYALAFINRDV